MQKESLICGIKTLKDFLNRLAVQAAAVDATGEMGFHPCTRAIPSSQGIVAFLKSEGVVPDKTGLAQHRIYFAIAL